MEIKLSIIIPTFNRSGILDTSLNKLFQQIYLIKEESSIEVVVSDNCSTDRTRDVVLSHILNNPDIQIKYSKNESNLGFDKNCIVGSKLAQAKFIWFLSDDDELKDGGLKTVIDGVGNNMDVSFIFLNYTLITPGWPEGTPLFLTENKRVNGNDLMRETKFAFSCITSCVFKRELFISIDPTMYIGTFWIHLYLSRKVAETGVSLIIADPIFIFQRPSLKDSRLSANKNKTTKREFFIDAHIKFLEFANGFTYPYSDSTKEYALKIGWHDNRSQILSYKLTVSKYNWNEIKGIVKDMMFYFKYKPAFWLLDVPLIVLPVFFSKSYFFFKLVFARIKLIVKPYIPRKAWAFYKRRLSV